MKQKLNVGERFALLSALPREGNFATLKIIRKLKEDLSFTEKEHEYYGFRKVKTNGGNESLSWSPEKAAETKDFEFGEVATDIIKSALKDLDKMKKLDESQYTVYEKFVEVKEK